MKYIRYEYNNEKFVGILEKDVIYRTNYEDIISAVENEDDLENNYKQCYMDNINDVHILPPTDASKIVCVGLNYKDHAEELNMDLPKEPLLFIKPSTSVISSAENINYPNDTKKLDFEGELAIVIGKTTSSGYFNNQSIAGYSIINDVTARDLQENDGQWTRAKSFDTFCPYGPVISTKINAQKLKITTKVNGKIKQNSNTSNMIFSPEYLVKYISNIMTLNSGDVIATGTPPGVNQLQKGDNVTVEIENIGILKNNVE